MTPRPSCQICIHDADKLSVNLHSHVAATAPSAGAKLELMVHGSPEADKNPSKPKRGSVSIRGFPPIHRKINCDMLDSRISVL